MNNLLKIVTTGKKSKGNIKAQYYINLFVILGFLLFIYWTLFLYPKTFVPIQLILAILFVPGLIVTGFTFKKLLRACGYQFPLQNNLPYNSLIITLTYFLITIPVGNLLVAVFLSLNFFATEKEIKEVDVPPFNIRTATSAKNHSSYSTLMVEYNGINKSINVGNKNIDSIASSTLKLKLSKGLFGYHIIRGYHFDHYN